MTNPTVLEFTRHWSHIVRYVAYSDNSSEISDVSSWRKRKKYLLPGRKDVESLCYASRHGFGYSRIFESFHKLANEIITSHSSQTRTWISTVHGKSRPMSQTSVRIPSILYYASKLDIIPNGNREQLSKIRCSSDDFLGIVCGVQRVHSSVRKIHRRTDLVSDINNRFNLLWFLIVEFPSNT